MENRSQCECVSFNILCEETEKGKIQYKKFTQNSNNPLSRPSMSPLNEIHKNNSKSRSPRASKQLRLDRAFVRPPWIP